MGSQRVGHGLALNGKQSVKCKYKEKMELNKTKMGILIVKFIIYNEEIF